MIPYHRTRGLGLSYLTRLYGSLVPFCLPAMVISGAVAGLVSTAMVDDWLQIRDAFGNSYGMSIFGAALSFLCVQRLRMSYERYDQGNKQIKVMHSKWVDACSQILAFDQINSATVNLSEEPFCKHVVRLFAQMSAMATLRLSSSSDDSFGQAVNLEWLQPQAPERESAMSRRMSRRFTKMKTGLQLHGSFSSRRRSRVSPERSRRLSREEGLASQPSNVTVPQGLLSRQHTMEQCEAAAEASASSREASQSGRLRARFRPPPAARANSVGRMGGFIKTVLTRSNTGKLVDPTAEQAKIPLSSSLLPSEIEYLKAGASCPVACTQSRIIRAITTRQVAGGMPAPAPQVSRIFQEISNGMLAFNEASRLKEVAVPFALVQLQAILLLLFLLIFPIYIASFTGAVAWVSVFLSAAAAGCFTALWVLANELEDPFGTDPNDLPMVAYHQDFCNSLLTLLHLPWMNLDHWTVREGRWRHPAASQRAAPPSPASSSAGRPTEAAGGAAPQSSLHDLGESSAPRMRGMVSPSFAKGGVSISKSNSSGGEATVGMPYLLGEAPDEPADATQLGQPRMPGHLVRQNTPVGPAGPAGGAVTFVPASSPAAQRVTSRVPTSSALPRVAERASKEVEEVVGGEEQAEQRQEPSRGMNME